MRVSTPSNASHVDLILWNIRILVLRNLRNYHLLLAGVLRGRFCWRFLFTDVCDETSWHLLLSVLPFVC